MRGLGGAVEGRVAGDSAGQGRGRVAGDVVVVSYLVGDGARLSERVLVLMIERDCYSSKAPIPGKNETEIGGECYSSNTSREKMGFSEGEVSEGRGRWWSAVKERERAMKGQQSEVAGIRGGSEGNRR
ncbi:hypothetical protein L6452_32906 [Arctium lappa]|uniref:Uncharacterized protein n=1 Tax=Arctium lappa TaxID=4217 RepID=A0ACB8Z6U2_ARCLA|nr:hypothetical protein L6452_32906 [Arctium lappa]